MPRTILVISVLLAVGGLVVVANQSPSSDSSARSTSVGLKSGHLEDVRGLQLDEVSDIESSEERAAVSADIGELEETQPAPEGVLWARRDISGLARSNIAARRESVEKRVGYFDGSKEAEHERQYAGEGKVLGTYSIMIIFDAEGRSIPKDTSLHTAATPAGEPDVPHYHISSGGMDYYIPKGEFPAYDRVRELLKEFPDTVPIAEVPMEGLRDLARRALAYRLP